MDENLILVMPFAYLVSFYLALIDQLLIIATWLISIFFYFECFCAFLHVRFAIWK